MKLFRFPKSKFFRNDAVLWRVVTKRVKKRMRRVRLESDQLGLPDFFQQPHHK